MSIIDVYAGSFHLFVRLDATTLLIVAQVLKAWAAQQGQRKRTVL